MATANSYIGLSISQNITRNHFLNVQHLYCNINYVLKHSENSGDLLLVGKFSNSHYSTNNMKKNF